MTKVIKVRKVKIEEEEFREYKDLKVIEDLLEIEDQVLYLLV